MDDNDKYLHQNFIENIILHLSKITISIFLISLNFYTIFFLFLDFPLNSILSSVRLLLVYLYLSSLLVVT